ncbi:hypothetical protein PENTCL1PPCAC_2210, partial [Pristionchus entomophagus]
MTVSLPDLRAQLEFPNITLRAEAFSTLISALKSCKDAKEKSDLLSLFWDCLFLYGDVVSKWACASIEGLKKDGLLPSEAEIILHCMRGVSDQSKVKRKEIVRTIFNLSGDVIKSALELQRRNGEVAGDVVDVMMERGIQQEELLAVGSILGMKWSDNTHPFLNRVEWNEERIQVMSDVMDIDSLWRATANKNETLRFIAHLPSSSLHSLDLSSVCSIQLGSLISQYPILILNHSLIPHPALLPGLLEICAVERDLGRVLCGGASLEISNQAKKLVVLCQQKGLSLQREEKEEKGGREGRGLMSIVEWMTRDDNRLREAILRGSRVDFVPSIDTLCLLSALLPYTAKSCPEPTMRLFVSIAQRATGLGNTIFLLCLTLLTRPWIEGIERRLVLETIAGCVTHRSMVAPALKMLSAICQLAGDRMAAIDLIGGIVEKYPTSVGDKLTSLTWISDNEDIEWSREKVRLIQRICVATDSSDAYLSTLNGLMKKGGPLLTPTIQVVMQLCRMDELDLPPVAAQIREKTKGGKDEEATAAFVLLLGIAAKEKEDQELGVKFSTEIFSFTSNRSTVVRAAAWKALAQFPIELVIPRGNEEDEATVVQQFLNRFKPDQAGEEEIKAFTQLLHSLLQVDVEQLPKPLYTTKAVREDDLLCSLLSLLTPSLTSLDSLTTLCLFRPICYVQVVDKRVQYALSLYRTLLAQAILPQEEDGKSKERLRWMAGWRDATKTLLSLLEATIDENGGNGGNGARDRINDELKRSIISSSSTLPTVCMVLTTMIGLGRGEKDVSTFSSFFTSAVTFIQLANDPHFKPRVLPLFQVSISSFLRSPLFTRSLLSLISLSSPPSQLAFFDLPIGKKDDIYWLQGEGIPKELLDRLLGLCSDRDRVPEGTSVGDVRLTGVALGVDAVTVEIVEDEMKKEEGKEIGKMIEDAKGEGDIETLFTLFSSLSMRDQQEWRPRLKRRMERIARNANECVGQCVLHSLSYYSLLISSINSIRSLHLPSNYDYLPKGSLLKATVERILTCENLAESIALVESLVGIKRKDDRYLPPIDCSFLIPFEEKRGETALRIIAQQKDIKQLCRLVSLWSDRGCSKCSREEMAALGEWMGMIVEEVGERASAKALELLLEASKSDDSLFDFIVPLMKCNIVYDTVISTLRPLNTLADLDQPVLKRMMKEEERVFHSLNGRLGWLFEVVVEGSGCEMESIKRILEMMKGRGSMWKNGSAAVLLSLLSNESADEIGEKMVHVVNVANLMRSEGGERREMVSHLWEIVTVFILASRSDTLHFPLWIEEKEVPNGLRDLMRRAIDRYVRSEKITISEQVATFATECLEQLREGEEQSEFTRFSLLLFIRVFIKLNRSSKLQQLLVRNVNWRKICEA